MKNKNKLDKGWSKKDFDLICKSAKDKGLLVTSKYRKGLKNIKFAPIVL